MKSYHLFLIAVLGAFMSIALYAVAVASPIQNCYEANNAYQSYIEKGNDLNGLGRTKEAHKAYLKAYDNAVTNAQKKTALGSLAVTSFVLGNQEQSEQYLTELLSIFPNNRWAKRFAAKNNLNLAKRRVAICKTILQGTYMPSQSLLSVDIQGIKDGIIPVGSTFDVTWKSDGSIPSRKKLYEFIVFTMPHTVRFNGSGFLMLPPEVKLPFGFKFASDKMRVLFPLYLPQSKKTQGTFQIRPLVAGNFTLQWAYVVVNECGDIVFSSKAKSQLITFEVQEQKPVIVVQDRVGMEEPEGVFLSPSKEYELRVFKNRFQVLYADTGELILERAGTNPNFSPGSRFIGYFPVNEKHFTPTRGLFGIVTGGNYNPSIEIIDILDHKIVAKHAAFQVVTWSKNESFLIIGFSEWGWLQVILPWLEKNNSLIYAYGCHACDAWETSQVAIDIENSLIRFRGSIGGDFLQNLINRKEYWPKKDDEFFGHLKEIEYLQLLQSLEFPIARKPPKVWELEEGFDITHIGIKGCGMNMFFSHLILKENSLINNNFLKKQEKVIRGFISHRGRILRSKVAKNIDLSKNVLERFGEMNITIKTNYAPLEQNDWLELEPKQNGKNLIQFEDYKKDHPIHSKVIDSIKTNYPAFKKLTYLQLFDKSMDIGEKACNMESMPHSHRTKYSVFKKDNSRFLIMQIECNNDSLSNVMTSGNIFIFSAINGKYNKTFLKKALKILPKINNKNVSEYLDLGTFNSRANEVKSFLSEDNILLISSVDDSSIIVFDANTQKVTTAFSGIVESQDLESLHLTQDGRLVLQINKGGHFYFYDIATQKRVLNGLYIDDEIVLYTDDGFYDATSEGAHYVTWYYPGLKQHFDFNQFESKFKRPDIIKAILTGQTIEKPDVQLLPPPTVEMVLKHPDNYAKQATVELSATSIRPLSNLRLFVDGAPVAKIPVAGKQAQKTVPLKLKRGKHWITAVAYNDQGYSSIPKSLMIDASAIKAKGGNLYVLGVGVDNYPNMPNANLDYAKQDIIAFAETARANPARQYENIVIKQILNEKATPTHIYQTLTNIIQQATIDDTLMLYFAGHGERGKDSQFYFLTSQASFGDFETTGLAWEKVAALLAQSKAKVIVFLDACHSGIASKETVVPNDEYVAALMKTGKAGMVVMAASKGRQFSFEDIDFGDGHGAFNYAITQALKADRQTTDVNQNGLIELSELYRSVKFNVHKLTDGKQTPWLSRNEIIGEMPVL